MRMYLPACPLMTAAFILAAAQESVFVRFWWSPGASPQVARARYQDYFFRVPRLLHDFVSESSADVFQ